MKIRLLLAALAILAIGAASTKISPALDVISGEPNAVKVCVGEESICFSASDFDDASKTRVSSITVLSLPESGKLTLDGTEIKKGQVISRGAIDNMRYTFDGYQNESFTYGYMSAGVGYTSEVKMSRLERHNFAPVFEDASISVSVASGSSFYGNISATDDGNDSLVYEIQGFPENGVLTVISKEKGIYRYKPGATFVGEDSFSMTARDRYGNVSEPITVLVTVEDCSGDEYNFCDIKDKEVENAARLLTKRGIMSGKTVGRMNFFDPNGKVSREEFLVMAMCCANINPEEYDGVSVFADEKSISESAIAHADYAAENGYLADEIKGAVNYFRPDFSVTVSEAMNILDKIAPDSKLSFAQEGDAELSRAECALLLARLYDKISLKTKG